MAEEIQNAPTVVPWSIMIGIVINGTLGLAMIVATLLCSGNINSALKENPLYPFMAIFNNAVQSVGGAAVMSSLVTALAIFATVGILASSSRMFWSFARDQGIPGWRTLSQVRVLHWIQLLVRSRALAANSFDRSAAVRQFPSTLFSPPP
jgi:choline transport protein